MVRLTGTFSRLGNCKVLVVGDFLLDAYTIGKAKRISPEAPVAVVNVMREEHRPGGAGNVVLNLLSMGCEVAAVGRVGNDASGQLLLNVLQEENVDVRGMVSQQGYPTPVKNRIIAENQQIVRVDHEQILPLPEQLEQQLIEALPALLQDIKIIAISDYGKGFLSRTFLAAIIENGLVKGIPVIADPKGTDFTKYSRATIIKPNLSEAFAAAGLSTDTPLEQVAAKVLDQTQSQMLMVTRAEAGISLFHRNGQRHDFPVRAKEVKDVTGAGDTVLAMLTCAMANGLPVSEAIQLSNVAAGLSIERLGCARISLSDLARRLLEHDVANKVFDEEHLFALQEALRGRQFALLALSGEQGFTSKIFSAIHLLGKRENWDLLIYIKDTHPHEEFINLLSSLNDVDFILLNGESLRSLCNRIVPDEVYDLDEQSLQKLEGITSLIS
jgi:rfaE bifunctional protein kinase chain/domain